MLSNFFPDSVVAQSIDTATVVEIGGIRQYLKIKGHDKESPVLLYLHGGPGQSVMQKADSLTSELEKHFVVVHWDQRETGQTASLNSSPEKLTTALMVSDAIEVVQYLLSRFGKDKLYLVGHSWGAFLGFQVADRIPACLESLVVISPPVDAVQSQEIALNTLKAHFKKEQNEKAIQQLASVNVPHDNLEQRLIQYRWQSVYEGETVSDEQVEQALPFFRQWQSTWGELEQEASSVVLYEEIPELKCPVYFIIGMQDLQTSHMLAQAYFDDLQAPAKKLFGIANAGHNLPDDESELMQQIIIKEILPNHNK